MIRSLALLSALLGLAACNEEPVETPTDDRRGAEGEVLGGTISDAMLPLPTVRSQSPPRESATASSGSSTGTPRQPGGQSAPTPEAGAAAEPEAESAPGQAEE